MIKYPQKYDRLEYARFTWRIAAAVEVMIWSALALVEIGALVNVARSFTATECRPSIGTAALDECARATDRSTSIILSLMVVLIVAAIGAIAILVARLAVMKTSAAIAEIAAANGITIDDDDNSEDISEDSAEMVGS